MPQVDETWFLVHTALYSLLFGAMAWLFFLGICLTAIRVVTGERESMSPRVLVILTVCVLASAVVGATTAVYQHDDHVEEESAAGDFFRDCQSPSCLEQFRDLQEDAAKERR